MYANSEIGTVQPIEEMGALIKRINSKRKEKLFFTQMQFKQLII